MSSDVPPDAGAAGERPRNRNREEKRAHLRHLLQTEGPAMYARTSVVNHRRYMALDNLEDADDVRSVARAIKEDAIDRLPELIETVRESVEDNGGSVYLAEDAADANRYVNEVVAERDGETVVKSKSMTTEEIDLNDALEAEGVDVYETDLGEWVIQVAEESPSHIVGPAMHRTTDEIAELFNGRFDPDEPLETAEELTNFARDYVGERIREADVGVTGANFVLADSGTVVLVTNEGNARKCAVTPDTHVAIAGVEKLIPTITDLEPFVELLSKSATGQPMSQYLTMLSPPTDSPTLEFGDAGDGDGSAPDGEREREFHLVLLDNGRTEMREDDQLRETLYCVRCGACSNVCANFQQLGGHGFGGETYSGGIATGWEAGVHGYDSAAEFNDLCTGCTRCVDACPVKIDIPWINTVVRDRINRTGETDPYDFLVDGLTPDAEPDGSGIDLQKRFFGNFETVARLASATAPVSNRLVETGPVRSLLERTLGIDRRRDLPSFRRETLVDWFESRGGSRVDPGTADREVILYPDVYTNYVDPERGKAAVRVLESLNVAVRVPSLPESGRAPLSQGMIATADERASRLYAALAEDLDAGYDVVVIEPSDLALFHREYERLLPRPSYERLRDASYEVCQYVLELLEERGDDAGADSTADVFGGRDGSVAYHSHCQQRTLDLESPTVGLLERAGYDVRTSSVECCGMAGSFGYKREYYDVSVAAGEPLAKQFDGAETVVASGTSCGDQLEDLLERSVPHPIELLDPAA
ncbi:LUD domain-containing protein [Natrialbaceae archaeon GCM10025810]|uniref:LUD domain-containing protein n=1 Tax=Halovalidus salilacus TaxID=3075124 RepID=UPI0036232585